MEKHGTKARESRIEKEREERKMYDKKRERAR